MQEPFVPHSLPLTELNWVELITLIGKANAEIARFDGLLRSIPNPSILLAPLTTQEAVLSSKIEGTQATLEEVLEFEANPTKNNPKYNDIQEIINYRKAINFAVDRLSSLPLSLRLIKEIHSMLLQGVRGQNKNPGNFRTIQNWIGKTGSTKETATFIPPSPEKLLDYLSNLENYFHYEEKDFLVQLAIIHAQFEIIHPFLDGNGRVGRILIPLFLHHKQVLSSPMFYLSSYLDTHRDEYYDYLKKISSDNDWTSWIIFFLTAITEQAKNNIEKINTINRLYDENKQRIVNITHSQFSLQTIDYIFSTPIFTSTDFVKGTQIPKASASRILNQLSENKILTLLRQGKGRSGNVYGFELLLDILE